MKATLPVQADSSGPATIAQLAKLGQLVADQNPTRDRMQRALGLIPDMLRADIAKVNRYDLCRLVGRELPFEILSEEFDLGVCYGKPIAPRLAWFRHHGLVLESRLFDHMSKIIVDSDCGRHESSGTRRFFVVGCCNESVLSSFDLQPANLDEFFESWNDICQHGVSQRGLKISSVSARHGSCWLRYDYKEEPLKRLPKLRVIHPDDDRQLYEEEYDGSPLHGSKCNRPTLVRRVIDLPSDKIGV